MSTTQTIQNASARHTIDQRLDAIDQALLGLVSRTDRLAIVAQLETRIRELASASSSLETLPQPLVAQTVMPPFSGFAAPQKRSRLAISSGVLGIVALALLFGMPVSYFVVAMVGDFLGEIFAIGFLGTHLLTVAVGGLAAVALGTAALIRLGRRKEGLVGHGWAIAGLCTGPIALFVGGSVLAVGGVQMLAANDFLNWAAPVAYEAPEPLAPPTAGSADSPCSDGSDSDEPDAATVAAAPAAITASLIKAARDLLDAVADERLVPDASPVNGPLAAQEPDSPETPAQPNDSASPEGTAASAEGKTDAANATSPECP